MFTIILFCQYKMNTCECQLLLISASAIRQKVVNKLSTKYATIDDAETDLDIDMDTYIHGNSTSTPTFCTPTPSTSSMELVTNVFKKVAK